LSAPTIALVEVSSGATHVYSRTYLPRVGIPTLAAILKQQGYQCDLWFQSFPGFSRERLSQYDIVGISSLTCTITEAYSLADQLKRKGKVVVMGGPHATFMPEEALRHCDYVVMKEGELSFPALAAALAKGDQPDSVPGIAYLRASGEICFTQEAPAVDYPDLPSPDFSLSPQVKADSLPPIIVTSRGCPHNCIFCSVTAIFGRRYRFKSNEQVIAELRPVLDRSICFGDDNFCAHRARTKSLLKDMIAQKAVPLRWTGEMCVDDGSDEELLDLMEATRCRIIFVGIESINPETLKKFGKKHNVEAIERCVKNLHRHNIGIHGMFVVGPDDDPGSVREIADYAIAADIDTIQIFALTPFPGTSVYQEMKGRMLHQDWRYFDGMHVVLEPSRCSAYDLQLAISAAMEKFYSWRRVAKAYRKGRGWRVKYRAGAHYLVNKWIKENREYLERLRTGSYRASSAAAASAAKAI